MQGLDAVKLRTVMEYKVHVLRKFLHAVEGQCDKQCDKQRDKQHEKQRDKHRDKQREKQRDKQRDKHLVFGTTGNY
jgi:hypothetical protein